MLGVAGETNEACNEQRWRRRRLERHFRAQTSLGAGVCAGIGDVLKLIKGHGWARHGTPRRVNNGKGAGERGAGQGSARASLASAAHLCEEEEFLCCLLPPLTAD